ncbi:PQQ-dependent sugar dehydrogenase [Deinococcus cellulosilyticus]|uniref:Pyrroloquinoline quinone-dependent pyranose dehydrogenase beta-propeller domain-containing protein n=1 Tax=Deinococcus cellulosilyticus (strain DSM 18568 / NBRC 106333 / KACC 11606 / 5516J-15) TaxID=1223518 RepID=A0A511N3K1_DEIC1|nr:sugar dehydrogenase [Deinococcus cellulosilyticus]GEM47028.1 hypothetical protein DC3_26630 [Deinococcus cellulosilyticus NBRC 106333 = KACC 11606]
MKKKHLMKAVLTLSLLGCQMNAAPVSPRLVSTSVDVRDGLNTAPFNQARTLNVPEGMKIEVVARVPGARFLAVTPDGNVLVSQPNTGKITLLRSSAAYAASDFVTGLQRPHDMVFTQVEGKTYLYVSEAGRITRSEYQNGDLTRRAATGVVENLPTSPLPGEGNYRHLLKNIALGNGKLYVSIASSTNEDPRDLQVEPKRGAIYQYDLDGKNGRLFATGIRNAEGLDFDPVTGELWAVVNQRDDIQYPYHQDFDGDGSDDYGKVIPDFVDNNPTEQFIKVKDGGDYGWPYCNPIATNGNMKAITYVPDVTRNPDNSVKNCAQMTKTDLGIQGHSAPLGLTFWSGNNVPAAFKNGATSGLHGSWNRQAFTGHKVSFFPFQNGEPTGEQDLVTGWVTDAVNKVRWGRPVDTAVLPDGSLLISDDQSGTVYRLYQPLPM